MQHDLCEQVAAVEGQSEDCRRCRRWCMWLAGSRVDHLGLGLSSGSRSRMTIAYPW